MKRSTNNSTRSIVINNNIIKNNDGNYLLLLPNEIIYSVIILLDEIDIINLIDSIFFFNERNQNRIELFNNLIYSNFNYKNLIKSISEYISEIIPSININNISKSNIYNLTKSNIKYIHMLIYCHKCIYCGIVSTIKSSYFYGSYSLININNDIYFCKECYYNMMKNVFDNNDCNFIVKRELMENEMKKYNTGIVSRNLLMILINNKIDWKELNYKVDSKFIKTVNKGIRCINEDYFLLSDVKKVLNIY